MQQAASADGMRQRQSSGKQKAIANIPRILKNHGQT
jgi:hypothetical protein